MKNINYKICLHINIRICKCDCYSLGTQVFVCLNSDKTCASRRTFSFLILVKISHDCRILYHSNTLLLDINKNSVILDTSLNVQMCTVTEILYFLSYLLIAFCSMVFSEIVSIITWSLVSICTRLLLCLAVSEPVVLYIL